MFRLTAADPPANQVRRITFVPFLADGRCVLVEGPDGPVLPTGEVLGFGCEGQLVGEDQALGLGHDLGGTRRRHEQPGDRLCGRVT
jgi:hypothetical protein